MIRAVGLLLALMLTAPSATASAQAPGRTYTIGYLTPGHDEGMIGPREFTLPELARLGFVEGKNLKIEWRFAGGVRERLPDLAKELIEARVDLIVAVSSVAIKAAKDVTERVPIVMSFSGEDPVAEGFVASLARPDGNITGMVLLAAEGDLKRIELLREAMPEARRIAYLVSPARHHVLVPARRFAEQAGFDLAVVSAAGRADYDHVFERLARTRPAGLAIGSFPSFFNDAEELAARTNALKIPSICQWREMAVMGCTLAFGPPIGPLFERVGWYVAKILGGQSPAELPVEQPTTFELVVNLRNARALGIDLPTAVLARAHELIE